MVANRTGRDRYFCRSCGGVTVYLTSEEAEKERAEGHNVDLWSEILARQKSP